jgi:precorrin-6B methylase 2
VNEKKFDPKKLKKLNHSKRLKDIPVAYILGKLELEQSNVFVDIGAGTAFFSIAFLQQAKPITVYACDISTTMLDWIKESLNDPCPQRVEKILQIFTRI